MTIHEEISADQGLPAVAAGPIGVPAGHSAGHSASAIPAAKTSGLSAFGPAALSGAVPPPGVPAPPVVVPAAPVVAPVQAPTAAQRPRPLRIGDKVRSFVDDVCVSVGLTGLIVNVAPPRYGAPARARVLWDNETVSMADATTFEVLTVREESVADEESRVA
ncbi:hypothetical protein [Nakamurella sp.]|uniref:hypothetical protein n=1 Tax=Nakamurella sp. TaxID=1869182 RepID=UPI003B3B63F8